MKQHVRRVYQTAEELLEQEQWSPEQVSHWAADNKVACISHMTIYRHIREDARQGGQLKSCVQAAEIRCYFAYPHRLRQRGSNENLNDLLRQHFPKRQSLAKVRQHHCDAIAYKLKQRPWKHDSHKTPLDRFGELLRVRTSR